MRRTPSFPLLLRLGLAVVGLGLCGSVAAAPTPDSARVLPARPVLTGRPDSSQAPGPRLAPVTAVAPPGSAALQDARDPRTAPVFASFERAWMVGNADSLLEHFGKRKVYISLPDGGPDGGLFSRAQSYFILKGLFDATRTEEFSFVSIRQLEDSPGTAIGRAIRTFRKRDSSLLVQDRLFVSLVQEDDQWVVAEIKSVR